jgi:hypothetical protein
MLPSIRGLFPQTRHALESGELLERTVVPPDPDAPLCADPGLDASAWPEVSVPLAVPEIEGLRLRLPRHFQAAEHRPGLYVGSGDGARVRTFFHLTRASGVQTHMTVGTSPLATQISVEECQVLRGGVRLHLLTFALRDGPLTGDAEETFYVSAVWPIRTGVWLMGMGDAPRAEAQQEIASIFRTVTFLIRP